MKKKSQSEIVSTMSLILFAIVAVIVIWIVVDYFLELQKKDNVLCADVKLDVVQANNNGVANQDTVIVKRLAGGDEGDVTGVKIVVNGKAATINQVGTTPCNPGTCDSSLTQSQTKTFNITTDLKEGDEVKVAAIVGESKYVCSVTDSTRTT